MRFAFVMAAGCFVSTAFEAMAGDFRIETKVYAAQNDEAPLSENLTLFQAGVVYDFLAKPETITIFRPPSGSAPGRFIVLDPARSMKMEVTTDQIAGLVDKLQEWAAEQHDPLVRFLGEPEFSEQAAAPSDTVVLTSKHMTYRVSATKVSDEAALAAYRQFSDWYARFNTRGGVLPFPRLAVNEVLFRQKLIPTQVHLKIPGQGVDMTAKHRTDWLLSKQDRQRIDQAQQQVGSFRLVSPEEFLRGLDAGQLE